MVGDILKFLINNNDEKMKPIMRVFSVILMVGVILGVWAWVYHLIYPTAPKEVIHASLVHDTVILTVPTKEPPAKPAIYKSINSPNVTNNAPVKNQNNGTYGPNSNVVNGDVTINNGNKPRHFTELDKNKLAVLMEQASSKTIYVDWGVNTGTPTHEQEQLANEISSFVNTRGFQMEAKATFQYDGEKNGTYPFELKDGLITLTIYPAKTFSN